MGLVGLFRALRTHTILRGTQLAAGPRPAASVRRARCGRRHAGRRRGTERGTAGLETRVRKRI